MNTIKKWALALSSALCFSSYSNAQDVTGNLIYSTANPPPPGSVYSWSGFMVTESGGGGEWGGNTPGYNPALGQFMFGYTSGTINYSMAVSSALSGTGIRVTGMEYGLQWFNQDFSRGTLSATWTLRGNGNNVLESYYHSLGATTEGWTSLDVTKTFTNPYSLSNIGNLTFSITGQDDRFWAGYYGPQVRNQYARLSYGADQCATNPLSSPTCAGFTDAMAQRTAMPAADPVTAAATAPAATATSTAAAPATVTTASRTSSPTAATPAAARTEAIVRSVLQQQTATQQATVEASQDQAQISQRGSTDQASSESPAAALARPGDPATAARGLAPVITAEPPPEPRVRPRVVQPPAELAGGVSVAAFTASVDITAYTNLALRDAPFYAPREIYRGQQTVDNRQALRGLGTDRLHQDMVDQQWRR